MSYAPVGPREPYGRNYGGGSRWEGMDCKTELWMTIQSKISPVRLQHPPSPVLPHQPTIQCWSADWTFYIPDCTAKAESWATNALSATAAPTPPSFRLRVSLPRRMLNSTSERCALFEDIGRIYLIFRHSALPMFTRPSGRSRAQRSGLSGGECFVIGFMYNCELNCTCNVIDE